MPLSDIARTALPFLGLLPRAIAGRFHRRRPHRHLKGRVPGGTMPQNQWWSGDDRWYERSFPPRQHNELTPLLDGKEAFDAMLQAIKEAQEYVYIVGWALTPDFALARADDGQQTEDDLLTHIWPRFLSVSPLRC